MKTKYSPFMLWYSLALNIILVGAMMNFVTMRANDMHMPVLILDPDSQYMSNYTYPYHKLYFNTTEYLEVPYFLLGDVIHWDWKHAPLGSGWYSLGDFYALFGMWCYLVIFSASVTLKIVRRYNKWKHKKSQSKSIGKINIRVRTVKRSLD